jgi:predicted DsbA family dithiol-disulfide isomerase
MAETRTLPVTIDVISDAVCPWCFIGKRKLDAALDLLGDIPVTVTWRPYQLDPTIPQGGISRQEYMSRKFGPERIAEIHARLEGVGADVGIPFAFEKITRSPNTLDAHRVIRWLLPTGNQTQAVDRLFNLYFVEGQDIGDRDLLAKLAGEMGLDEADVRRRLDTDDDKDAVTEEIGMAQRIGVNGVPFYIFANKLAVSGAQPPDVLAGAIRQAAGLPAQS